MGITGADLTASFVYDALGRRVSKTINGQTTQYQYDGNDIVAEINNGAVSTTYLRGLNIDEPFVRRSGSGDEHYLSDALGSTLALTDNTGAVTTRYSYDPFGNTTVTGTSNNPFQYTGRENDGTGLYYYRARYYSPKLQRFISEDPIGFAGGDVNFYAYVLNNPVNLIDPLGLLVRKLPPMCQPSQGGRKDAPPQQSKCDFDLIDLFPNPLVITGNVPKIAKILGSTSVQLKLE